MGKTEAPAWLDWMQNSADSCDWINYLSICGFSDRRPRRWRFFGCDKGRVPALPPPDAFQSGLFEIRMLIIQLQVDPHLNL
jgi:hypothetical protein